MGNQTTQARNVYRQVNTLIYFKHSDLPLSAVMCHPVFDINIINLRLIDLGVMYTSIDTIVRLFIVRCYSFAVPGQCNDGADIAFMVDNAHISLFKYRLEKEFVKNTMKKLVTKSSQLNAAIVLYNDTATGELNLTERFEINHFLHVVENLDNPDPCTASLTRIDRALQFTADRVFGTDGGSRLNTPKIAVLLTHSAWSFGLESFPLRNASESLKQKGIRLLVVGTGPGVEAYKQELQDITETNDDLIIVKAFSSLFVFENELVDKICSAIGK